MGLLAGYQGGSARRITVSENRVLYWDLPGLETVDTANGCTLEQQTGMSKIASKLNCDRVRLVQGGANQSDCCKESSWWSCIRQCISHVGKGSPRGDLVCRVDACGGVWIDASWDHVSACDGPPARGLFIFSLSFPNPCLSPKVVGRFSS